MIKENDSILTLINLLLEDEKKRLKREYIMSQNKNIEDEKEMIVYGKGGLKIIL